MTKKKVDYRPINEKLFKIILEKKGKSIKDLGNEVSISASDKTIRRSLNKKKLMRIEYIREISKYLNVDPRVLTGELIFKKDYIDTYPLKHLEEYPFDRDQLEALKTENIKETLARVLALFNRSYAQFENMDKEEQFNFQEALLNAMYPVVTGYFKADGYGRINDPEDEWIIHSLDSAREDYYEKLWAENTLRPMFLINLPTGYTKRQIEKLTPDELLDLDYRLKQEEELKWADTEIRQKYLDNPPDGYTKETISSMSAIDILYLSYDEWLK